MEKTYLLSKLQLVLSAATPQNFATVTISKKDIELRVQFIFMFIPGFLMNNVH
jgi:hypothetical protein